MSLIIQLDSHPLLLQQMSSSAPVVHSAGTAAVTTFSRLHTGLEVMNDGGGNYCVIACDEISDSGSDNLTGGAGTTARLW